MSARINNIFAGASAGTGKEDFLMLFESNAVKIERIVSHAHSSPAGFWYDQPHNEWVMLVRGGAILEFADGELVKLKEGDYLAIPPHVKHRIRETELETIWLAVHVT
jgi:cupin 2 domain-containing protein